jgi:hypothetical protein
MHLLLPKRIRLLPLFRTHITLPFSTAPHHPTIDKILKSEDVGSLQAALAEVGGLSEKNRETALKIVLSRIFSGKLPLGVLDSPKVAAHLVRHPGMHLEALLFRIKELMKSLADAQTPQQRTETLNAINDNFVKSFDSLKKISSEGATRHEAMLHKRFADYNLLHLSKAVAPADRKEVLKKSKDFYLSALGKMGLLIREQQDKLKKGTDNTSHDMQHGEEEELKVNALKETIRLLIETNSENAFHLFMVEKELSVGKEDGGLPEGIIGLLPYIERSLGYYEIFKKMKAYSIFYHRLKKLSL